jgi:hypothetical protein
MTGEAVPGGVLGRIAAGHRFFDVYATFAKEGGRVGSGTLGSGQGGIGRCVS